MRCSLLLGAILAAGFLPYSPDVKSIIQGKVIWDGPLPAVSPLSGNVPTTEGAFERVTKPNPNAPMIDSANRGVSGAVVFLRGIDAKARPWNLPAVTIEQRDLSLHILQGGVDSNVGFVQKGARITALSRDKHFHSLRARGAAFFSLPFVTQNQPSTRQLSESGVIELSSGAGYIWMQAYLFVDEHPYYARTQPDGSFILRDVPTGKYELVCWMPNWHIAKRELDPESSQPSRIVFQQPANLVRPISLDGREKLQVDFKIREVDFRK